MMADDMSEFESDGMVTDEQLNVISGLCKQQKQLESELEAAEEKVKEAKRNLRKVQENDLPDALVAAGVTLFRTDDGWEVELNEKMTASISAKNKPAAIKWLIDHDLESLVKENVEVPFDKGESAKVAAFISLLEANGVNDFSVKPTINTSSVKASLKELIEQGVDVPESTFGLYFFKQAIVKKAP